MKTEKTKKKKNKRNSRSFMLEILDYFGFRLKLDRTRCWDQRKWHLVWKKKSNCPVFFVRHYDYLPFRRCESHFSLEEEKKEKKPKKSLSSCFAEFLGNVEMFEPEDDVGWLKNPLFGCKSLEEAMIKKDLAVSMS